MDRKQFEKWVGNPHKLWRRDEPGYEHEYGNPWTNGAWAGWQASKLDSLDLDEVIAELRREYRQLNEEGVSYEEMSMVTGLPESTFSMWLSGYRDIVKVSVVQALLRGRKAWSLA